MIDQQNDNIRGTQLGRRILLLLLHMLKFLVTKESACSSSSLLVYIEIL